MELKDLKELIELVKDTDITDFQVEKEGTKVRIKRDRYITQIDIPQSMRSVQSTGQAQMSAPHPGPDEDTQRLITITAPLVGTFYRSPSPDAAMYVEVGARVKKGQTICIIEAMKLMNEIEAEVDGVVLRILVENNQPVEYGEPLFLVEPL